MSDFLDQWAGAEAAYPLTANPQLASQATLADIACAKDQPGAMP